MKSKQITMEISGAVPDDAAEILKLQKLAFFDHIALYQDPNLPMLKQAESEIKDELSKKVALKFTDNDYIIGSVRAYREGDTCFIERLVVHPSYQNKGIGKRLMHAIENAFELPVRFELHTGNKSVGNLHFYKNLGYNVFKTVKQNDSYHLVYLEKRIGDC